MKTIFCNNLKTVTGFFALIIKKNHAQFLIKILENRKYGTHGMHADRELTISLVLT